jgi:4-hydroxy-4-methyl-2-oxoglutarate aldolase
MSGTLTDRLAQCYTGVVHDVMRARGLRDFVLPAELRPILPEQTLAGPAFTIEGMAAPGSDAHATLLAWTGLLSQAPAGHVWVSQPNDRTVAHMGELSAETLKGKGVRGCVCDGGIRDVNFLLRLGFQSWARFFTPRDIVGHWLPRATGVPITIGDVEIAPGDYMLGDRDGLVRIPSAIAAEVVAEAERAMATENRVRTAILAGTDPQEAYLRFGKF